MAKHIKYILTLLFILRVSTIVAEAQVIRGESSCVLNTTYNYYVYSSTYLGYPNWQASGGTVVSQWQNGMTYYADIRWTSTGTRLLTFANYSEVLTTMDVYVCSAGMAAGVSINGPTNICAGKNNTYTATPTNGGSPYYVWKVNNVAKQSSSSSTFITALYNVNDVVSVTMTSSITCTSPRTATASKTITSVTQPTAVTANIPQSGQVCPDQSPQPTYTCTVTNGGSNPQYKWYRNGSEAQDNQLSGNSYKPGYTLQQGHTIQCRVISNSTCYSGSSTAWSNIVTISVTGPPSILQPPSSVTICDGAPTSFSVSASGAGSYQWQRLVPGGSWGAISGATSSTYSIASSTEMNDWSFRCYVTGLCGLISTSSPASITFSIPTTYTVTGTGSICQGASRPVGLSGSQIGVVYTCYRNGSPLTPTKNGTGGAITFGNMSVAGTYTVVGVISVTGCAKTMPTSAVITVNTQPAAITGTMNVCAGSTTQLSNTTPGGTWSCVPASIATISSSGLVTGISAGSATITYTLGTCYSITPFTVNTQPVPITGTMNVCAGSTTQLSNVTPGGSWSSTNTSVATVNSTSGVVTGVSAGTTTIKYSIGSCFSQGSFTVRPLETAPTGISINPFNNICPNTAVTLTRVGGSSAHPNAVWKWYSGSCGSILVGQGDYITVSPSSTTTYFVRSEGGCVTTSCASLTVTVLSPPVITQHPTSVTICDGAPTSFSVSASGSVSYQWQNLIGTWTDVPGETSSTYSISSSSGMNGRRFRCVVTGNCNPPAISYDAYLNFSTTDQYPVTGGGTICQGTFTSVTLGGSDPGINYVCYLNGSPISSPVGGDFNPITFSNLSLAGTYTVNAITNIGCLVPMSGSAVINYKTTSTPATSITAPTTTLFPGEISTLTVNGGSLEPGVASWKWYSGSGTCGSTPEGEGPSIKVTPNTSSTYYVRAEGGCITTSCVSANVSVKNLLSINRSIDISKTVGTTTISPSVSQMGAATISIPIFSAPGTNGMTPSISLFYSSQSGNGILGYGWHIGGLSNISRTGKTMVHDNEVNSVSFTQSDRFSRDGERLMLSNGTYGSDNSIYHSESSPFSKITAYGSTGSGPSYFKEETKNGFTYEYGNTTDSKEVPGGISNSIYSWLINKATDNNGNYIKYIYNNSGGEYWLRRIEYTGNSEQGLQPYDSLVFIYDNRTIDKSFFYVGGGYIPKIKRLTHIIVYCEGSIAKKYEFSYANGLLSEIIEYDNAENIYNPVVIKWGDNGLLTEESNESEFLRYIYDEGLAVGDYNGDGSDDIVLWGNAGDVSSLSLYNMNTDGTFERVDYEGFSDDKYETYHYRYRFNGVSDFNGDGLDDLVLKSADSVYVFMGQSSNQLVLSQNDIFQASSLTEFFQGDFNGDGIGELLLFETGDALIHSFSRDQSWNISVPTGPSYQLVDFDGDGKTDLLTLTSTGYSLTKFNYNTSTNQYSTTEAGTYTSSLLNSSLSNKIFEGDFNGDSKTDFLIKGSTNWYFMYSTGIFYELDDTENCLIPDSFNPFPINSGQALFVRDINGDGKSDIIEISTHYNAGVKDGMVLKYHLSKGMEFKIEYHERLGTTALVNAGDFIFGNFYGDRNLDGLYSLYQTFRLKSNDRINVVESIINGFNHKTKFTYNNNVLKSDILTRPSLDTLLYKPFKQLTVDSLISTGSDGVQKSILYSFANPFYHKEGKGFLGFANQSVTDNTTGYIITDGFNANEEYVYSYPSSQVSKDGAGRELLNKDFQFSNKTYSYGSYFAYQSRVISRDLIHSLSDTTLYNYDSYGNDTLTVYKQNGELVTIVQNQFIQKGTWCPANLASSTITKTSYSSDPDYQKFSEFGYDIKGRLIRSSVFVNLADSLYTTYTYNNYGNIVSKTTAIADGNTRSEGLSYDAKYRFVTGLTKGALTYSYNYNPKTGSVLTETLPNNLTKTFEYDGFGRQTRSEIDASKYLTTEYEWSIVSPAGAVYSITQSDGLSENKAWFDDSGKNIRNKTTSFNGDSVFVDKQYSQRGELIKESKPYFNLGTPSWNVFSYDTIGRIESYNVNGSTLSYSYNGNETTTTKQLTGGNRVYTVSLNGIGQVASTTQNSKTLNFIYGNNGGLTSVTPPFAGSSVSYNYDSRPMMDEEHDPDRGTSKFNYNSLGELTHLETAKGDADSIIYDIVGRDSIRIRENGNTNYSYYESGVGKGKVSQINSPAGIKKYSYDLYGNIIRECDSIPTQESFPFTYVYDDRGRMSRMTYPGGFAITYHYNLKGFLQYIKKASDNSIIWQCNSVNEYGNITQYSLPAGSITVNKSFDANGYLTEIKTLAGSTTKQWFEYYFNPNSGDLEWRKDSIRSLTENFGYDVFDQLKWSKVNGQDSLKLDYNDIGNIMYKSGVGDYFYNSNRVHAVDSINGSQNMERQNIEYNFFNKPVYISTNADSLVYIYNPLDQRIKAVLYNSARQFVKTTWYAGPYEKVIQGTETKHYYYINSPDGPIALAIQEGAGTPVIYYICKDHLGSITGIMNSAGNIVEESNFDPWGRRRNPVDWSYSNVTTPTFTQRGFTGHEHLDMFNLIHMNGRIYDSEIARFLSPDPVIQDTYNLLNYNRYSYCLNNPLRFNDPTGYIKENPGPPIIYVNPMFGALSLIRSGFHKKIESLGIPGSGGQTQHPAKSKDKITYDPVSKQYVHSDGRIATEEEMDALLSGNVQREPIISGISVDATGALASFGYTVEAGFYTDGNEALQFVSNGQTFGLEASVGFNFILIIPKSNFKFSDLEGMGTSGVINIGLISISIFGNSSSGYPENSVFDSYLGIKIGIGAGSGGSYTPSSNTSSYDWIPDISQSFFHWR